MARLFVALCGLGFSCTAFYQTIFQKPEKRDYIKIFKLSIAGLFLTLCSYGF